MQRRQQQQILRLRRRMTTKKQRQKTKGGQTFRKMRLRQRYQLGRKQTATTAMAKMREVTLVLPWRGEGWGGGQRPAGGGLWVEGGGGLGQGVGFSVGGGRRKRGSGVL